MKTTVGFLLCIVAFCFLLTMRLSAQEKPLPRDITLSGAGLPFSSPQQQSATTRRFKIPGKKVSQYNAEDWGAWIDSTWGAGQTAAGQLNVFDIFWTRVDQYWGGFPNLALSWDSLRTVYRPQIGSGLSRGRFYALMSRMWLELLEFHTFIYDTNVESIFGNVMSSPSFQYKSGVPLLRIGTGWLDPLGAPVTPMPDSSGLVYRAAPGNPLGLAPGDLVLGYEGTPWKRLYGELLDKGVPVSYRWSSSGSTPESETHMVLSAVGWNWGLFDTIDVVKYSTGDTLHLPTAPLSTLAQTVLASDQVPIAGVPMPEATGFINGTGPSVSYGVIQGTNIGYVYAWDWWTEGTTQLFSQAISDLCYNKKVNGLVIDTRMNWGGEPGYANGGLAKLFNFDPTYYMSFARRNSMSNHFTFSISGEWGFAPDIYFAPTNCTPSAYPFDRPIAVLIGPAAISAGDYNAFRMRFHPMVRFFGKPTNGAFPAGYHLQPPPGEDAAWHYAIPIGSIYSNVPGEGYLIHKGVQPDEEVWLTRDGVAKGEDNVVKKALEWITTLTYAHDITLDRHYARPGTDSVRVMATLTNPLQHPVRLTATVTDTGGAMRDSVLLYNDGLHGDGSAGDSVWGCRIPVPADEGLFGVSVRTEDMTQGAFRRLPNAVRFATAGPLSVDSLTVTLLDDGSYMIKPYIKNHGASFTVAGVSVTLSCADPWVEDMTPKNLALPSSIPPGGVASPTGVCYVYPSATFPGQFNLRFDVASDGYVCWSNSNRLVVTGVKEEKALPVAYALRQNYPNPFNPSTTIKYELPKASHVNLTVYDILGRQVSVLVNEKRDAGVHEVKFDAAGLGSGVYFYRIHAGDFTQTKRLLLLK